MTQGFSSPELEGEVEGLIDLVLYLGWEFFGCCIPTFTLRV
jgi:hypothetical protein